MLRLIVTVAVLSLACIALKNARDFAASLLYLAKQGYFEEDQKILEDGVVLLHNLLTDIEELSPEAVEQELQPLQAYLLERNAALQN